MNIALKGHFLREGLRLNGHQVHDLVIRKGETLGDALKRAPAPVDLVIWELFGAAADIQALGPCEQPLAAYCIDTPLNQFWLKPCVKNFDAVFVDQPQCVGDFAGLAPHVSWLPLPAQDSFFQAPRPKKYDITFIGTTNARRLKRNNLLRLLRARFDLNIRSGLTIAESQKVFAESKIVLNENFFPGLTLRVLQGLGAAAAVFTERSPYGHDFGLGDFRDLVFYTPDSLLERMSAVLANYGRYAGLGAHGQETCRALYGSAPVAAQLLARVPVCAGRRNGPAEARWNRITAELLYAQRFGGDFSRTVRALAEIADSSSPRAAEAELLLGDVRARVKNGADARAHYLRALEKDPASPARLKLALLDIRRNELAAARDALLDYARRAGPQLGAATEAALAGRDLTAQGLLTLAGELAFALGRRWDMGFNKDFRDPVPDTAFELARMAWEIAPSPGALDLMQRCLRPRHMQGELLPLMLTALQMGLLTDVQILETARTAFEYYDHETASDIMSAMRKTR